MEGDRSASFPRRLGRYDLLLPIASGGMATVYLARLRFGGFDRSVAIKCMHPHLRDEPEFVPELLEEAKLAAKLHHPNVVGVLDVGDDPNGPFLVMDYVEGGSLAALERATRASGCEASIALRVLDDALAGLHSAHELTDDGGRSLAIVHRDVSPHNILVGVDGLSRLTDFGIAKAATREARTRTGAIKGKIAYMAPEQLRGEPLDRRCDVWAAAIVAWELLAGRRPFEVEDEMAVALRIAQEDIPRLRSVRPELPAALDDAIAFALERDPRERCPSAAELRRRLGRAAATIGLAPAVDVGHWVQRSLGSSLDRRRREVEKLLAQLEDVAPTAAGDVGARGDTSRRSTRRLVGIGSLVAATAVGAVVGTRAWLLTRPPASPTVGAVSESAQPLLAATSAPEARASVAGTPSEAPATRASARDERSTLAISANAPLRSLRIGEREIALTTPSRVVAVDVSASELEEGARISAVAVDGRRTATTAQRHARSVAVVFGSGGHPRVASPNESAERLLPSPYSAKEK